MAPPDPSRPPSPAPCPACGGRARRQFASLIAPASAQYRCRRCGLGFIHPVPAPAAFDAIYQHQYTAAPAVLYKNRTLARDYFGKVGGLLNLQPDAHLVEVGGAYGFFCALARERLGCRVTLVETGDVPTDYAAGQLSIDTFHGNADHFDPPEPVDAVFCGHVFEHLPDSHAFLRRCAAWLKPGGRLVMLCPNGRSWKFRLLRGGWAWALPEQHVTFLTPDALPPLAQPHGLAVRHCSSHVPHPVHYPGLLLGLSFWIKNRLKRRHYLGRTPLSTPSPGTPSPVSAAAPPPPLRASRLLGPLKRVHRGLRLLHHGEARLTRAWDRHLARRVARQGKPTTALDELCVVLEKTAAQPATRT